MRARLVDRRVVGNRKLGHGGGAPGYLTEFRVPADRRTAIAVACNGDGGSQSDIRQLVPALETQWLR